MYWDDIKKNRDTWFDETVTGDNKNKNFNSFVGFGGRRMCTDYHRKSSTSKKYGGYSTLSKIKVADNPDLLYLTYPDEQYTRQLPYKEDMEMLLPVEITNGNKPLHNFIEPISKDKLSSFVPSYSITKGTRNSCEELTWPVNISGSGSAKLWIPQGKACVYGTKAINGLLKDIEILKPALIAQEFDYDFDDFGVGNYGTNFYGFITKLQGITYSPTMVTLPYDGTQVKTFNKSYGPYGDRYPQICYKGCHKKTFVVDDEWVGDVFISRQYSPILVEFL